MKLISSVIDKDIQEVKNKILEFESESNNLTQILKEYLSQKSKFIRSTVSILFFKCINKEISEEQYRILVATELIHNASLISDDAIDGSVLRRGVETLNIKFDNKLSIIAGDYLISLAIKELLKLHNNDVLNIFFDTIAKMCEAEGIQYFFKNEIPFMDVYLKKTQYKTAELFKACCTSMSLYGNSEIINLVREFAINFGIAFQIKNDLDDYKKGIINSLDIRDGVYTAPIIFLSSIEDSDVAIEKTLDLIHNYSKSAKLVIQDFENNEFKQELIGIIDKLCI